MITEKYSSESEVNVIVMRKGHSPVFNHIRFSHQTMISNRKSMIINSVLFIVTAATRKGIL